MESPEESQELELAEYKEPVTDADCAFEDYKNLGTNRNVAELHRMYTEIRIADSEAYVPTTSIHVLARWEQMYRWRDLAFDYDNQKSRDFEQARKTRMLQVHRDEVNLAGKMLEVAERSVNNLLQREDLMIDPQDISKFIKEGTKLLREAESNIQALEDPKRKGTGSQDTQNILDLVRESIIFNVTNMQVNNGK